MLIFTTFSDIPRVISATKNVVGPILEITKILIPEGDMTDQDHLDHQDKIRTGNQKDRQVLIELEKDHLTMLTDLAKTKRCHETEQKLIETRLNEHKLIETRLIEHKLTETILIEHKMTETILIEHKMIEHKMIETSLTERKLIEKG